MFVFVFFDFEVIVFVEYKECFVLEGVMIKCIICVICDIVCNVVMEVRKGWVICVWSFDNLIFCDNICMKGIIVFKVYVYLNWIFYLLKCVG